MWIIVKLSSDGKKDAYKNSKLKIETYNFHSLITNCIIVLMSTVNSFWKPQFADLGIHDCRGRSLSYLNILIFIFTEQITHRAIEFLNTSSFHNLYIYYCWVSISIINVTFIFFTMTYVNAGDSCTTYNKMPKRKYTHTHIFVDLWWILTFSIDIIIVGVPKRIRRKIKGLSP